MSIKKRTILKYLKCTPSVVSPSIRELWYRISPRSQSKKGVHIKCTMRTIKRVQTAHVLVYTDIRNTVVFSYKVAQRNRFKKTKHEVRERTHQTQTIYVIYIYTWSIPVHLHRVSTISARTFDHLGQRMCNPSNN